MENLLSPDELRDSARRFLGAQQVRSSLSRDVWTQIAELGWLGLSVPARLGGLGQPFTALAVLHLELGRVLSSWPFMSTVICLDALSSLANHSTRVTTLIEQAIAGDRILAPISAQEQPVAPGDNLSSAAITALGELYLSTNRLMGTARHVLDAGDADLLLICVNGSDPRLLLLNMPHPNVALVHQPTWDTTRRVFSVTFDRVPIEDTVAVDGADIAVAFDRMAAHRDVALACDAVGGMAGIFRETLDYMKVRRQFGRPIASFQALKHRCADLHVAIESARSLVEKAAGDFAAERSAWRTNASVARLYAEDVYRTVTEDAVQLHGGVGFTWDHPCHLFLKRARLSSTLGGTPEFRKDAVAPDLFRAVNTG